MNAKRFLIGLVLIPCVAALVVAVSFPFLAVNAPSGGSVAVVEGWIPEAHLPHVEEVIDSMGYDQVYVTGTIRPCSYTLRIQDTLVIDLTDPTLGELELQACGSNGAGFVVLDERSVLFTDTVTGECHPFKTSLTGSVRRIRITPSFTGIPQSNWELLYLASITIQGRNLHDLQRNTAIHLQDGEIRPGAPTYADVTSQELIRAGHDPQAIITLRTLDSGESRTWANAKLFALRASRDGISTVDVISFGIHARRSRVTYQTACGRSVNVGVISIADPEVEPGKWWRTAQGWFKVVKELAGVPASYLVDRVK